MDAYVYSAALWCGQCVISNLVASGKASPAAREMAPADALEQITESAGFSCESDYDSDDLPKGPYAEGGGEADSPQHCDGCGTFLRNPLTPDGAAYVRERVANDAARVQRLHGRGAQGGPSAVIAEWAEFYSWALEEA